MLHDCDGPALGGAINNPVEAQVMWEDSASAYFVLHDQFFRHIVKVAFTHAPEPITYVLFYEFFVFIEKGRKASLSFTCRDGGQSSRFRVARYLLGVCSHQS